MKFNTEFNKYLLKSLRNDLKKLKIKIPKIENGLGNYIYIEKKEILLSEEFNDNYYKRYLGIINYLEKYKPEDYDKLNKYVVDEFQKIKK